MQPTTTYRVTSIDILRGIVMIIMALDHTRDFFHITAFTADPLDPATTTYPLFFTRWITHFCAPVFVFLSGVSAYMASRKKTMDAASTFLIKRGLWLVLAEITIVSIGITFNPLLNVIILQVIWAIGMSMVLLGLCMRLTPRLILPLGVLLFFGHGLLDFVSPPKDDAARGVWNLFLRAKGSVIPYAPNRIILDLYALLPWTGVMFMGYSIGGWFTPEFAPEKRKRNLLYAGTGLLLLYMLLRFTGWYGDPVQWQRNPDALLSFLNTEKYPPSLQYLGMTLGPSLIALALLEKVKSRWTAFVSVYGSVPFFYYILHFYLIHIILIILFFATGHLSKDIVDPNNPLFFFRPVDFGYSLPVVYGIWAFVVLALYLPCRWYSRYKKMHSKWWLSYI